MRILDVFTHFMPPRFLEKFREHAPDQGMFRRSLNVQPLCNLDARFRLMDEFGDYRQVISLGSPPIESFAERALAGELARGGNGGLAALGERHPERFAGFLATLPMNDPDAAVAELERAVRERGAA